MEAIAMTTFAIEVDMWQLLLAVGGFIVWQILDALVDLKYGKEERTKADIVEKGVEAIGDLGAKWLSKWEAILKAKYGEITIPDIDLDNIPSPNALEEKLDNLYELVSLMREDIGNRISVLEQIHKRKGDF